MDEVFLESLEQWLAAWELWGGRGLRYEQTWLAAVVAMVTVGGAWAGAA